MSTTLFCLVKGNTSTNAFSVKINRAEPISELKEAIKAKKQNDFAGVDADKLKLWMVEIPADRNDLIQGQPQLLQYNDQLKATDYIDDYWTATPKRRHIHVIVEVPTAPIATVKVLTGSSDALYVIVDDPNIYIEGKFAVAEMERIGVVDGKRKSLCFNQLRLDYGRLLKMIQKGRTIGENPVVVGSIPPTDSLWEMIRNDGFTVKTYPRNAENREKRVDMRIGQYMNRIFRDKVPGVLALVAGGGDFQPVLQDAVQLGWTVEIYFWNFANSLELLCDENTPIRILRLIA